ncbi:maleylpyruvate isomerase family mycothiol-dependent enzyme [Nocardioides sp. BGMRC 2183]|nr:maleylpyruvate isomerase family mycothiol-dependent enzyme [Nocardioides sp. BGMRC 2183]
MREAPEWTDLLDAAIDDVVEAVSDAPDLAVPVPACPEWTLAGLVDHLREVHWWAAHAITEQSPDGSAPPVGLDRDALVAGYVSAAEHLLDIFRATPAQTPAWTFGTDRTVAFWLRRQAHEVTLHLRDALQALGRTAEWSIDPGFAWDGVEEVATVFYPRQVRLERTAPLPGTLRLQAEDLDETLDLGQGEPYGVISGPAADVLLTLWRRRGADDAVAAELLEKTAVTP